MPGPQRVWNNFPQNAQDPALAEWGQWITSSVAALQAPLYPPQTPQVTTISHPNAVQVVWNEVGGGTTSYAVFEVSTNSTAPGVPFATVPANTGAASNSILRASLNDTVTRFYIVQAIAQNSRSAPSTPSPGAALSSAAAVIPVSQTPVNQGGVGGGVGGGGGIIGINRRFQQ